MKRMALTSASVAVVFSPIQAYSLGGPAVARAGSPTSESNPVVSQFVRDFSFAESAPGALQELTLGESSPWSVTSLGEQPTILSGPNPSFVFPADGATTLSQDLTPESLSHIALRVIVDVEFLAPTGMLDVTIDGENVLRTVPTSADGDLDRRKIAFTSVRDSGAIGTDPDMVALTGADARVYSVAVAPVDRNATNANLFVTGAAPGDLLGGSVAGAGDVDGDGFSDIIVGAYRNDDAGLEAGAAYVISGRTGQTLYTLSGAAAFDFYGISVAGLGDLDGDGFDDFGVGAFFNDLAATDAGAVYVYSGATGLPIRTLYGGGIGYYLGGALASAGDVNNDGVPDIIVGADGAASNVGAAFVFSGADGSVLHTFIGEAVDDHFGVSVNGAGDVNNDGFDDVIVGAVWNSAGAYRAGRVYVYSGQDGSLLHVFTGTEEDGRFGISIAGVGDVDADGHDDVIVGSPRITGGFAVGLASVYSGIDGSLTYFFIGEHPGDLFGMRVGRAGDVDRDGVDDIVISASENNDAGLAAGRVYVVSGATGLTLLVMNGESSYDRFGLAVAGAGDVDGNGFDDIVVGAVKNESGGADAGRAYLYHVPAVDTIIPPRIGLLDLSTTNFERGDEFTVDVTIEDAPASKVEFWLDSDASGDLDQDLDTLMFTDTDGADGWGGAPDLTSVPAGSHILFAVARSVDAAAIWSAPIGAAFFFQNPCPTDIVIDRVVDGKDLAEFLSQFNGTNPLLDYTGDGVVNGQDLSYLLAAWGPCP